ncbi:hypothetical protein WR25_09772 [Diploscapter pachys]|uniref:Protein kinase domain-containing protein n=1 Tax=Diploscapter pachys TaxID=2018661 RepID=A0A2A2K3D6_9BILA|nr:hypothetical protein WR25_09772 [Diploscapter pachys]
MHYYEIDQPSNEATKMSDDEDETVVLKNETVVESSRAKYRVLKKLGAGGFGDVYRVEDISAKVLCAMKVEVKKEDRRHSKLKMEIGILKMVSGERALSHFTRIIDRGKKDTYFFLVMELVGKSLQDLKMGRSDKIFSISTGLGASKQCLEAIEDLHKYGFIHRDIKPANYAAGLKDKNQLHLIYILDFGIARKITNDVGELKTPRTATKFKGTIKFAAMNCHLLRELGYKDDCESWFYQLIDLINIQDQLFYGIRCSETLGKILSYIDQQQSVFFYKSEDLYAQWYCDKIDYFYIYQLLEAGAKECGGDINAPYDWERD